MDGSKELREDRVLCLSEYFLNTRSLSCLKPTMKHVKSVPSQEYQRPYTKYCIAGCKKKKKKKKKNTAYQTTLNEVLQANGGTFSNAGSRHLLLCSFELAK